MGDDIEQGTDIVLIGSVKVMMVRRGRNFQSLLVLSSVCCHRETVFNTSVLLIVVLCRIAVSLDARISPKRRQRSAQESLHQPPGFS